MGRSAFSLPSSRWHERVVVITGASAGVGRAIAAEFARAGAALCLIARDADGLDQTRAELEARGARVLCIPTDVADAEAMVSAAARCADELGPIDVWVNNAMVTVFSPVSELTADDVRRVTEVTYLGSVHGVLAVLPHMRRQGHGTIVQVGSALAYRAIPLQAAYCGAKHALRGFLDSLRTELLRETSPIRVTSVHLPAIDTPQFDWARTRQANQPRPVPPVYTPEVAARAVVRAAAAPRSDYWLGRNTPLLILAEHFAPGLLDRYLARTAIDGQDTGVPVLPGREDNLYQPVSGRHHTHGTFGHEASDRALLTTSVAATAGAVALVAALGAAAGAWLARRRH